MQPSIAHRFCLSFELDSWVHGMSSLKPDCELGRNFFCQYGKKTWLGTLCVQQITSSRYITVSSTQVSMFYILWANACTNMRFIKSNSRVWKHFAFLVCRTCDTPQEVRWLVRRAYSYSWYSGSKGVLRLFSWCSGSDERYWGYSGGTLMLCVWKCACRELYDATETTTVYSTRIVA